MSDYFEYFEEEQRIDDVLEDALSMLTDELTALRLIASNLVRYDNECLARVPRTMKLNEIIDQARKVVVKHGGAR